MTTENAQPAVKSPNVVAKYSDCAKARLAGTFLFFLVLCAFLPAIRNDFLTYDDPEHVTDNPFVKSGLTSAGIKWAFGSHGANWHPVTWLSHIMDGQIFGLHPWGHHLTNVLIHAANCFLLFWVLRKLSGAMWRSFFVALLFGLHPLRVESVAWVSERKDVLSVFFFLLALWSYTRYVEESRTSSRRGWIQYGLAMLWFLLGLMSKSMLVTFPFVLLLLDFWPLERLRQTRPAKLLLEKLPFFAMTAAMSLIAHHAQKYGAAMVSSLSFTARFENAIVSYCRYLEKLFWPANLSPFYPRVAHWPILVVCAAAIFLAAVSVWSISQRKQRPWCFVGWFWYLGTLVPVIGLVQIGEQSIADRYTYIPCIGILIALVWSAHEWTNNIRRRESLAVGASVAAAIFCVVLTIAQIGYWRTTETLFARALRVTPDSTMACIGLGACLADRGQFDDAIPLYRHALEISPGYYEGHYDLALALAAKNQLDEAVAQYGLALQSRPTSADCHLSLGIALARQGHVDAALAEFKRATELDPANVIAQSDYAMFLLQKGQITDAIEHLRAALKFAPNNADLHNDLGSALAQSGQLDAAITEFQTALNLNPSHPRAGANLARAQKLKSQSSGTR